MDRLSNIRTELLKITQAWASRRGFDPGRAVDLRHEAVFLNHAAYLTAIPAYKRLAREQGCERVTDISTIKTKLMMPVDLFKSYEPGWLEVGDFTAMDGWLSSISRRRISTSAVRPGSVDDWIEGLAAGGIVTSYSSGTSGRMSFVPRDRENWALLRVANRCYLTPLLMFRTVSTSLRRVMMGRTTRLLPPSAMAGLVGKVGLADFDAVFLGFRNGNSGNQMLMRELGPLFRRQCFLYDADLSATALACVQKGVRNDDEGRLLEGFRRVVVEQREDNWGRVIAFIRAAAESGQKVFLFGAPYEFKELCESATRGELKMGLRQGSLVLFGGGWKSYSGKAIDRDALVRMMAEVFELPPDRVLEGYSMTELSLPMVRCDFGRFHIPPLIEPVVFNEELCPIAVEGKEVSGAFGFLDPLAISYPGFLISDDRVKLVNGDCGCGLGGPAVTSVGRMANREIKGCGGIVSSLRA